MTNPSEFDLPQGTLDLLILRVVALGPVHGYAIAQRIQLISQEALQIQQGSLYPALHRLENKNFLAAEWGPTETGREAKFYRLTAKGRTQLTTETESWIHRKFFQMHILGQVDGVVFPSGFLVGPHPPACVWNRDLVVAEADMSCFGIQNGLGMRR